MDIGMLLMVVTLLVCLAFKVFEGYPVLAIIVSIIIICAGISMATGGSQKTTETTSFSISSDRDKSLSPNFRYKNSSGKTSESKTSSSSGSNKKSSGKSSSGSKYNTIGDPSSYSSAEDYYYDYYDDFYDYEEAEDYYESHK